MATTTMNHLRVHNASSFIDSVRDSNKIRSHLFVGKHTAWENNIPPTPDNTVGEYLQVQNDILGMQEIQQVDCRQMIRRVNWVSGLVYDIYRHDYKLTNISFSGASNIYDANFAVFAPNRHVYVCLDNNNNTQSTVAQQDLGNDPFYTSDGYQWLRLYRVSISNQDYVMDNYLPITTTDINEREKGAIFSAQVEVRGFGYDTGEYYCHVDGDGLGAVAKVNVESGAVTTVRIVRPGINYTYGTIRFKKNQVFGNLVDLDNDLNKLELNGDGTAVVTPIISPLGGWGYDLAVQLGATRVGIFALLGDDIPQDITYHQVGILQDPKFNENDRYIRNTGKVIYLSNVKPVTRVAEQNEKINLLIAF